MSYTWPRRTLELIFLLSSIIIIDGLGPLPVQRTGPLGPSAYEECAMKSSKIGLIVAAVSLVGLPLLAKNAVVASRWTAAPVQINADMAKWEPDSLARQKSVDIDFAFKNDAANLYCVLVFNDPKYLSSIAATGITFWVNADGKNSRSSGIHFYQRKYTPDGLIKLMESRGEVLTDQKRQNIKAGREYVLVACDLINKKGQVVPHAGSAKGVFRSAKDGKSTIYEFLVPMSLVGAAAGEGKWDVSKPLTLGVEWGA